jgi:TPP-dependent indolepyruvate ferredoxin oxidoreductase alpha subunit
MNDFKTRLIEEQAQLEEKLNKLNDFNQSEKANEIDPVQKSLLIIQSGAMYTYNECLKSRLERL